MEEKFECSECGHQYYEEVEEFEFDEQKFRKDTQAIFDDLIELLVKKQYDYKSSFKKNWKRYGPIYVSTRLDEKMDRLRSLLLSGDKPRNESIEDTFSDIIGYGILSLLQINGEIQ